MLTSLTTQANELSVGLLSDDNTSFVFVDGDPSITNIITTIKNDLSFNGYTALAPKKVTGIDYFEIKKEGNELKLLHTPPFSQNAYCIRTYNLQDNPLHTAHKIADSICYESTYKEGIACTKIIYSKQIKSSNEKGETVWQSEIWQCDYDGGQDERLSFDNTYSINPVFMHTPHVNRLPPFLFVSYKLGESKIVMHQDMSHTPFVQLSGNQLLPSCSPSGDKIAFISDISGHIDLFVQHINPKTLTSSSKPIQVFSVAGAVQASPSFRPDGKKIAFVSDHEKTPRIYIIDTPGLKGVRNNRYFCLSHKYRENTSPSWSPDGKKIAYSAKIDGVRQIVIYDFIKKEEIQVTFSGKHKENPSWSPTSGHLVFNTIEGNTSELFTFNLKQNKLVQITSGPHKKHYPNWSPYIQ